MNTMTTKSVKLSDAIKKKGKSREFVKNMNDEEIKQAIVRDTELREIPHGQLPKAKRTRY